MTSFKNFLAENAHQGFDLSGKLKTIDDLVNPKRLERALAAVAQFEDGVRTEKLYNVVHSEAKDAVKSLIQNEYESIWSKAPWIFYKSDTQQALDKIGVEISSTVDAGSVKKVIRSLESAQKVITDASVLADFTKLMRLASVFSYCTDAFKATQTKVIKGRKPSEPDPSAFRSKMGSAHSVATVRTHLLKSITPPLDDFEKQLKEYFDSVLAHLAKLVASGPEIKPPQGMDGFIFQQVYDYRAKGWDDKRVYYEIKPRERLATWPHAEAQRERKKIEETFLYKNALKLSAILDLKGNLTSIDVLPTSPVKLHSGAGTLSSEMEIKFADGSCFNVRNKVIINTSSTGHDSINIRQHSMMLSFRTAQCLQPLLKRRW